MKKDTAIAGKIQLLGRTLVLQLQLVLRTMRIHDSSNRAMLIASENLKNTINTLWAAVGGSVQVQFVNGVVYVNDVRLRLENALSEQVQGLQVQFDERGLGGLAFSRPVDSSSLKNFMLTFATQVDSEEDAAALRKKLQEFHALAMDLVEPQHFKDNEDDDEALRVDKKTFALQTYAKTVVAVKEWVRAINEGRNPMKGKLPIVRIVQDLVDIATERVNFLIKMAAIKSAEDYAYNHAANTCILALVMGRGLDINRLALVDLGISALLADIAFALLPEDLINSDRELTEEEELSVRDLMVQKIQDTVGTGNIGNAMIRRVIVAYEHHLPFCDPETGEKRRTHIFSRIVAVADAFDALTTRRPWREGFTADEAMRILLQEAGTRFDPVVVRVLVNLMGMYPLGSAVWLASGELGIVYHNSNSPEFFEKPWVKIIQDVNQQRIRRTVIRNLADEDGPGGKIVSLATAHDLGGLDSGMAVVL